MEVIEVNGRDFRTHQKTYLDLSDKGTQVVIRRGINKRYIITPINPVEDYDRYLTPEMRSRINQSLKQAAEGKVTKPMNKEELLAFLDTL
ncbi:MAG: hypothetical protein LBF81_01260 [Prevotellaceae bacterium]|jgi:hypothetical protein|nr:hypothetical protein [Prevotellaceae bacterium]